MISINKEHFFQNVGAGLGAAIILTSAIVVRGKMTYDQDSYCQQNGLQLITCGVASGEMPLQAQTFNSLTTVSGTAGTSVTVFTPNIQGMELLASTLSGLKSLPNQLQYIATATNSPLS